MSTTILLADDHVVVRDGLRLVLETQADFRVIGEANNGREAVRQATRHHPDVIIMDIAMPELSGIEATWQIVQSCPTTQVIILSMYATVTHVRRALHAGAHGYVLKSSVSAEVIDAIRAVRSGKRFLSQKISNVVSEDLLRQDQGQEKATLDLLSSREREILSLVVEGKTSAEIANLLSLAPSTVDTYRSRLMEKLDLHTLPDLVKFAIRHGLTSLD
jgi:DNA-binding NarL/FixJ family response regulator